MPVGPWPDFESCLKRDKERRQEGRSPLDYWEPRQLIEKIVMLLGRINDPALSKRVESLVKEAALFYV